MAVRHPCGNGAVWEVPYPATHARCALLVGQWDPNLISNTRNTLSSSTTTSTSGHWLLLSPVFCVLSRAIWSYSSSSSSSSKLKTQSETTRNGCSGLGFIFSYFLSGDCQTDTWVKASAISIKEVFFLCGQGSFYSTSQGNWLSD